MVLYSDDPVSFQMQGDHRVGVPAVFSATAEHLQATHAEPSGNAEDQQYPRENKGVDYQVADVVAACGNVLLLGDIGPILYLSEQPLSLIRVGRRDHHGYQGTAPLGHGARQILKSDHPVHGDLRGGVIEYGQLEIALGAVENPESGLRAVVEGGHRRRRETTDPAPRLQCQNWAKRP